MHIAVIDLGTNTFNLLIAEDSENCLNILCNKKISVKLGQGGIGQKIIVPEAILRGINAIEEYKQIIEAENVTNIYAIGTSALRTAENAEELVSKIEQIIGTKVEIISGNREAELIYLGVRQTIAKSYQPFVIIDIGGGSNEIILANHNEIIWKESFPLGMARLNDKFKPSDPIKLSEISALENYFEEKLQPFFEAVAKYQIECIVGAEGAFETFYNMAGYLFNTRFEAWLKTIAKEISYEHYIHIHNLLIQSSAKERQLMKGLEPFRVEMVVPASIFVNFILKKIKTPALFVSPYSLKEGVAWEYFNSKHS